MVETTEQSKKSKRSNKKLNGAIKLENNIEINLSEKAFLSKIHTILKVLDYFYTKEEKNQILEAYKNQDINLLDEVINKKFKELITEDLYDIENTTDPKIGFIIVTFVRLLAPYSLYYAYIRKSKEEALIKLQQLLKKHPVLEREINTQLTYIYLRFSDIINKLEYHLTESFVEQYVDTLFDLFYIALIDDKYIFDESIGFGAITSIIQTLSRINISKKAKYNILYQDVNYENIIIPTTTIKQSIFAKYQEEKLLSIIGDYVDKNSNEHYLYKNFLFDMFIMPTFIQEFNFKYYNSFYILPAIYKIAIVKLIQNKYPDLIQIFAEENIPAYIIINTRKLKYDNENYLYISKNNTLFYTLTYKDKSSNYGIRKLQRYFPSLKLLLPKLNVYPLYQEQICLLLSCMHYTFKNQNNVIRMFKLIEKKINDLII